MIESQSFEEQCQRLIESQGRVPDADRLEQFLAAAWHQKMADNPEWATAIGYPGFDDRWSDCSPDAMERKNSLIDLQLRVLDTITTRHLTDTDQLSHSLFKWGLEEDKIEAGFHRELLPLSQMDGVQQDSVRFMAMMPMGTAEQIENALSRLDRLPVLIDQTIDLMREGLKKGITPPRVAVREVPDQVASQISERSEDAPILTRFKDALDHGGGPATERAVTESFRLYAGRVRPAFRRLQLFIADTYLPGCRTSTSWSGLPRGDEWYAWLVRHHTTTEMTPDEVFEVGQTEVARIRSEMAEVIKRSGFRGDFSAFCEHLRTDPQFYFGTPSELLMAYRDIAKRVDPELIHYFGLLPRLPYGVVPVPAYSEKAQTTAYYEPGSPQAGRPGNFFANTYNLRARPRWEMEALTLHEAVPGHHLQIALAQEMEDLPEFRRNLWITAYGEGWALYSESLGEQMGFYQDAYSKFGQLTYEMWRAIRLVVDPGMHAKGWSRQQAIDFFVQNSSKPLHDITVEIDRYIVWPGQALAYKIGELKIRQLRRLAEEKLGERFDIRAFHDQLLASGCVPLAILEQRSNAWMNRA